MVEDIEMKSRESLKTILNHKNTGRILVAFDLAPVTVKHVREPHEIFSKKGRFEIVFTIG